MRSISTPASGASGVSGAVLVADTLASGRTFKRDEERLLRTFAGQLATTLEKAQINASLAKARVQKNEFAHQASHDALTGLANRSRFRQCLADGLPAAAAAGTGLAALFIDLDDFKTVNDTMGHAAGDVALKQLAARVKEWLRPVDHIARFGGEEFVVMLTATPVAEAQQVLTRLQRQLSASLFMHDGREVFVTFSAGVTDYRPGEALELALERADEALYEAKRTGKNRTCIA